MRRQRLPDAGLLAGSVISFVLLLSSVPLSAAAPTWSEVRSPHFVVVTDAGEKRSREVALRFEQIRAAFGQVIYRNLKVNVPVPVEIVGFRSNKELRQFAPLWNGKPIELSGYFQQGEDRDFIALDLSSEAGWQVVFHEFTHLLLHANFTDIPVWFDEGFAEYFASLEVQGDSLAIGSTLRDRSYVLDQNRWMSAEQLFSVTHNSPEYNEKGDHRSVFYAESWFVVHYMIAERKLREMANFLTLQAHHVPVTQAFQQAFGMPPAQFDKILHQYFGGHNFYFKYPAPQGPELDSKSYSSRTISDVEGAAALADLHLHEKDYQETALKEFEEVLAKQPDNATAHRGLGYAYLRKGDFQKAEQHFEKAVAAGSTEPETYYLHALMLTRAARLESNSGEDVQLSIQPVSGSAQTALMKKELQAAIALNPDYADAHHLLAVAQAADHDYAAATAAENRAFELSHKEAYALNLANFCILQHKWEDAEKLLRGLSNSFEPSIAAMARINLAQLENLRNSTAVHPSDAAPIKAAERFQSAELVSQSASTTMPPPPPLVDFAKAKLVEVDCSDPKSATLSIMIGTATWKMHTDDRSKLILINADTFSCDWHDRPVSVNYRRTGDREGSLMTLEFP